MENFLDFDVSTDDYWNIGGVTLFLSSSEYLYDMDWTIEEIPIIKLVYKLG
jgi:hypothetical protein